MTMRILFATDGSACTTAAAELMVRLPLPRTCHVTVLTVLDDLDSVIFDTKIEEDGQRKHLENIQAQRDAEAARLLEDQSQRLQRSGWTVDTRLRHGEVANQIIESAVELGIDLIVVGSHGLGGAQRFLIGNVSQKVVEYAPCSVLVVRPADGADSAQGPNAATPSQAASGEPLRFLLALDGSEPADAALGMLAGLELRRGLRVTIVRVLVLSHFYRMDILEQMTDSWQEQKHDAQKQLEAAAATLGRSGADTHIQVREGAHVSEEILTAAREDHTDIIVVGHKGRSGVERFLLGSVSRRLVTHADCSVWVHRGSVDRS